MLLRTWLPYDWTPRSEAYFVFPLAQDTPGKQCGLAATGVYQPSLRSPWLAAEEKKDYASALKHHKEYVRIKDALFTQQSEQKIQSLRITFKLEQAEREYRLLKQKNAELARSNKKLEQLTMRQQALNTQKSQLVEQLESYAHRDSLTNLFNRRYMDKQFQVEFDRAFSNDSPLCVMICDIDDFKQVNDQHSHTVGDQVLVELKFPNFLEQ